jgi:hypothetical protein
MLILRKPLSKPLNEGFGPKRFPFNVIIPNSGSLLNARPKPYMKHRATMEPPFSPSFNNSDDLCPRALYHPEIADSITTHEFDCSDNHST